MSKDEQNAKVKEEEDVIRQKYDQMIDEARKIWFGNEDNEPTAEQDEIHMLESDIDESEDDGDSKYEIDEERQPELEQSLREIHERVIARMRDAIGPFEKWGSYNEIDLLSIEDENEDEDQGTEDEDESTNEVDEDEVEM